MLFAYSKNRNWFHTRTLYDFMVDPHFQYASTITGLQLEVFKIPALPNSPALWGSHVKSRLLLEDLAHIGQYRRRAQISSASYGS